MRRRSSNLRSVIDELQTYENERLYLMKTMERFEQLHRDHVGAIAAMRDNLEGKFRTDLNNAWTEIRKQNAKIEAQAHDSSFRRGKGVALGTVWGVALAVAIELLRYYLRR
jgi:hypothetical protein